MRYIENWLKGLGLEYVIPRLKENGITTPKKLAQLNLRDMYELVAIENAEDRKKLYFLIQRLQSILQNRPGGTSTSSPEKDKENNNVETSSTLIHKNEDQQKDDIPEKTDSEAVQVISTKLSPNTSRKREPVSKTQGEVKLVQSPEKHSLPGPRKVGKSPPPSGAEKQKSVAKGKGGKKKGLLSSQSLSESLSSSISESS